MKEEELYLLDPVRRKTTIRSLVRYAMYEKQAIFLGLFLLILAVGAELTGPYIAKVIIDEHIVAIEKDWVEVKDGGRVKYDGASLRRSRMCRLPMSFKRFQLSNRRAVIILCPNKSSAEENAT